jgi:hypothetical protein
MLVANQLVVEDTDLCREFCGCPAVGKSGMEDIPFLTIGTTTMGTSRSRSHGEGSDQLMGPLVLCGCVANINFTRFMDDPTNV